VAITVLVVRNGQGVAVLRAAGHAPPINQITVACGAWSLLTTSVGTVSTGLVGPTNALLSASGERWRQYTAGVLCGLLAMLFGLLARLFTGIMLATPLTFIATLGGLAMLRVLQSSFVAAFSGRRPVSPPSAEQHVLTDLRGWAPWPSGCGSPARAGPAWLV
jgi:benzoate membrane transport protein